MAIPRRSWYLHLTHYVDDQGRGTIPFTPAVQVYYAFDEALNELLEEGVANRIQRYKKIAMLIRDRMAKLGVKPVLPPGPSVQHDHRLLSAGRPHVSVIA